MVPLIPAVVGGSLAAAALSLLLSRALTYDPWAWVVWGREVAQLQLDTTAGPAWKPLPVAVTSILSPLGDVAPDAWLVVARASGAVAVVLVARIAYRAAARHRLFAAITAAGTLLVVAGFARSAALGGSEALLIALAAAALDRHLEGRRRQAFLLGVGAALLRPEVWPFLALYGVWLVRRGEQRALVAAAAVLVPVLWFAPELWGSGDVLRSSNRALIPNPGAPALAAVPSLAVAKTFVFMLAPPALLAFAARGRVARLLVVGSAGWVALVAALSELGFSGEQRYLLPAAAAIAALAGIGAARVVATPRRLVGVAAAALVATAPFAVVAAHDLVADLRDDGRLRSGLARAVAAGGGPDALRCGGVAAGRYRFPVVAWHLDVSISDVSFRTRDGVVLRSRLREDAPVQPGRPARRFRLVADEGGWEVWSTCA